MAHRSEVQDSLSVLLIIDCLVKNTSSPHSGSTGERIHYNRTGGCGGQYFQVQAKYWIDLQTIEGVPEKMYNL